MKMCQFFTSKLNESVDEGIEDELSPEEMKKMQDLLGPMFDEPIKQGSRGPAPIPYDSKQAPGKNPLNPVSPRKGPPSVPHQGNKMFSPSDISAWEPLKDKVAGKQTLRPMSPSVQKSPGRKTLNPWELLSKVK